MTAVYEWHNEAGELLYIGVSEDVVSRAGRHEAAKAWWEEVAYSRVTHYPTREEALAVERVLIRHYQPTYNIRHNPRAKPKAKAIPQGAKGTSAASVLPIVEAMDRANVPLDASINRSLLMLRASGPGYRRAYVAAALRVRRARIEPFEPSLEDLEALPDPW